MLPASTGAELHRFITSLEFGRRSLTGRSILDVVLRAYVGCPRAGFQLCRITTPIVPPGLNSYVTFHVGYFRRILQRMNGGKTIPVQARRALLLSG